MLLLSAGSSTFTGNIVINGGTLIAGATAPGQVNNTPYSSLVLSTSPVARLRSTTAPWG